jgi:hypothetical protein
MADNIQATPRNYFGGLLTDAYKWMQSPERTQQMQGFAGLLGTTGVPQTIERMAYGEPLTNIGRANVPLLKPETADALMTVAGFAPEIKAAAGMLPKNLPVGMSIKPVDDVVGLLTPKIDELTGLPLNADGTVTLFHHTNKSAAEQIAKTGRLKSAGEPSVYLTTQKATDTGYGDVAVPVRVKPSLLNLDDEFPSGRMDFSIDTGKPKGSIPVTVEQPSFTFPQEEAMRLAQQRAALPIEQGGLGLLSNNTAADRAAAMGFDLSNPQYHATDVDFTSIRPSSRGKMGAGVYTSPDVQYAEKYAAPNEKRVLPLVSKGYYADADKRSAIFDQVRENAYANNPEITSKELHDLVSQEMQNRGYSGFDVDKERLTFNPEDMRSRFAAFDPFRKTAATAAAMGVAAPDLLAQEQPVITQQQIDDEMAKYGLLGR